VRWTSGATGEQRHGVPSIPAKGRQRLDQSGSGGWWGGRGSFWALEFGWGGAAVENSGERLAVGLVVARKKKGKTAGRKGSGRLYRGALLCRREGEGEQMRSRAQVDGRRRRAPRVCMATARHRRPDVAEREGASRGGAGVGSSQATRRTGESGAGAAEPRETAGEGSGVAQIETEEKGAGGGRRGLLCDFPKVQGPH
jgi:hypothetical protein